MTAVGLQPRPGAARITPATEQQAAEGYPGVERSCAVRPTAFAHIALRFDGARPRRFHAELATRLSSLAPQVSVARVEDKTERPTSVELLLDLERLVYRLHQGLGASGELPHHHRSCVAGVPDVVIDLTAAGAPDQGPLTLGVLYDGDPGELGLFGALFEGRVPLIQIVDRAAGTVLTEGMPATDNAGTIAEALDCVLARTITLILAALKGSRHQSGFARRRAPPPGAGRLLALKARSLAAMAIRRLYHLCCYAPHWRVMWRRIEHEDVWDTGSLLGPAWNVIPDPGFRFFADPFPHVQGGETLIFVEDLDHRTNKGIISVVRLNEQGLASEARPVLEEPWHLSYPFLIQVEGQIWMIPESSAGRCIALYRADPFPDRWVRECILIDDLEASDATIVDHDGQFWMFAATRDGEGSWSDTLSIFMAPNIRGPWRPHPANPVLVSQSGARPAGAIVKRAGALLRPVQDCARGYGTGIGLATIERLDEEAFAQRVTNVLRPLPNWPGKRLHTLNRAASIECIDGAAHSPRHRGVARILESRSGRAST